MTAGDLKRLAGWITIILSMGGCAPLPGVISTDTQLALHRGVYEVVLQPGLPATSSAVDLQVRVSFRRPDGQVTEVDAFLDADKQLRARAYCDERGNWTWTSQSPIRDLDGQSGSFRVVNSNLQGKLRIHAEDPRQFARDDGEWFLHLGDTGYRYVVDSEPNWQAYIDQAARAGFTKIRVWFARDRHNVDALFVSDRSDLDLAYWQEIDRRLLYALQAHPQLIFQVIPYAEDTEEIRRYGRGDLMALDLARQAQARWSALPNVTWVVTNDRRLVDQPTQGKRDVMASTVNRMGQDMAAREPWGTLISNHQARFSGYRFVDEDWSDVITLHDLDQVNGELISTYRSLGRSPVVLDEDRYETHRPPRHARYYFRRLFWASLLSGGHPTYGGLRTWEAYDGGPTRGVQGYFDARDAGHLAGGADDLKWIQAFFRETGITLVGMRPVDKWSRTPGAKIMANDRHIIIYVPNPDGGQPVSARPQATRPSVELELPSNDYDVRWFDPRSGKWLKGGRFDPSKTALNPPQSSQITRWGDWVVLLSTVP